MPARTPPLEVVVAGGGVAALEARTRAQRPRGRPCRHHDRGAGRRLHLPAAQQRRPLPLRVRGALPAQTLLDWGRERIEAERIVCLPLFDGPAIPGVRTDVSGFIPVDAGGRLPGAPDAYAVGDATTFPIKQGGLACQQAAAVAESIAAAVGAPVEPTRFRPVLRGKLMTGGRDRFLRRRLAGDQDAGEASDSRSGGRQAKSRGGISPHICSAATNSTATPQPGRSRT